MTFFSFLLRSFCFLNPQIFESSPSKYFRNLLHPLRTPVLPLQRKGMTALQLPILSEMAKNRLVCCKTGGTYDAFLIAFRRQQNKHCRKTGLACRCSPFESWKKALR